MAGGGRLGFLAIAVSAILSGACATTRPTADVAPAIAISPGAAERIGLMDRYRLGDDIRKRMMARPKVWVEEVPDQDEAESASPPAEPDEGEGDSD